MSGVWTGAGLRSRSRAGGHDVGDGTTTQSALDGDRWRVDSALAPPPFIGPDPHPHAACRGQRQRRRPRSTSLPSSLGPSPGPVVGPTSAEPLGLPRLALDAPSPPPASPRRLSSLSTLRPFPSAQGHLFSEPVPLPTPLSRGGPGAGRDEPHPATLRRVGSRVSPTQPGRSADGGVNFLRLDPTPTPRVCLNRRRSEFPRWTRRQSNSGRPPHDNSLSFWQAPLHYSPATTDKHRKDNFPIPYDERR